MFFKYHIIDSLPALAWLAKIEKGAELVDVFCGKNVETRTSFFVAGVWDGDFNKGDFDVSKFPCCTGGTLNNVKSGGGKIHYSYSFTRIPLLNRNK